MIPTMIPRLRKPRGQGATRRAEILSAAKAIFVAEGTCHATMRRIACEVGVSPTALYMYFADKNAILQAIAGQTLDELLECLRRARDPGASPTAQLRALLTAYVTFGLARPDEYRLTFLDPGRLAARRACGDAHEAGGHAFAILRDAVQAMIDDGSYAPADATRLTETIWAALHGATVLLLDQCDQMRTSRADLIETLGRMVVAGFK